MRFLGCPAGKIAATAVLGLACGGATAGAQAPANPSKLTPPPPADLPGPKLSGRMPLKVDVPDLPPEGSRPAFDRFSWQSFIALNWPSDPARRGEPLDPDNPAVFRNPPAGSVTVWGSYKEAFELFDQGDKTPTPWASYAVPIPPCGEAGPGAKVLVMASKGGTLLDSVDEAFSFPLIDQFRHYARTEIRFNRAQYDFIRDGGLYLAKNLAARQPITMPMSRPPDVQGAIMLKATWREMTPADDLTRYYTVRATVVDPPAQPGGAPMCSPRTVGLVGLHIVHKVDPFSEWIWSSFEQVDNIERGPGATPTTPISFNNGTDVPKPIRGYANRPKDKVPPLLPEDKRVPVQVARVNAIPTTPRGDSTVDLNRAYQALLKGTVWEHYQLVITQWPTKPKQFTLYDAGGVYPRDSGEPFPPTGCTNVALETYLQSPVDAQGAGGNSCMSCHYTAGKSDFSWTLQRRAH